MSFKPSTSISLDETGSVYTFNDCLIKASNLEQDAFDTMNTLNSALVLILLTSLIPGF